MILRIFAVHPVWDCKGLRLRLFMFVLIGWTDGLHPSAVSTYFGMQSQRRGCAVRAAQAVSMYSSALLCRLTVAVKVAASAGTGNGAALEGPERSNRVLACAREHRLYSVRGGWMRALERPTELRPFCTIGTSTRVLGLGRLSGHARDDSAERALSP